MAHLQHRAKPLGCPFTGQFRRRHFAMSQLERLLPRCMSGHSGHPIENMPKPPGKPDGRPCRRPCANQSTREIQLTSRARPHIAPGLCLMRPPPWPGCRAPLVGARRAGTGGAATRPPLRRCSLRLIAELRTRHGHDDFCINPPNLSAFARRTDCVDQ